MNPVCTSTPNAGVGRVRGRKSIHNKEILSPIQFGNLESGEKDKINKAEELSDDEEITSEDEEEIEEEIIEKVVTKESDKVVNDKHSLINYYCQNYRDCLSHFACVLIIIIAVTLPSGHLKKSVKNEVNVSLDEIKLNFPNQGKDFWHYITSNIKEVQLFDKPSIILFLYQKGHEGKSNELITRISWFASKILNKNFVVEPIILDGSKLNTVQYSRDYGILIEDYRHALETRRVMVVRNLENVRANVSQAFHVICDEYSPLVRKSFIIFGLEVPRFAGKETDQAGRVLRNIWRDLDADKLEPLVARVTNLVLKVNPEL